MKILFVDDDEPRTRALREGLAGFGEYEVVHVRTPQAAITAFASDDSWSGIVLDIMLPHYDLPEYRDFVVPGVAADNRLAFYTGLRVLQRCDQIMTERGKPCPVIILTHVQHIEQALRALGLSVAELVFKPVSLGEFLGKCAIRFREEAAGKAPGAQPA